MTNTQTNNITKKDITLLVLGFGFILYLVYPLVAFIGQFYIDSVIEGLSLYRNVNLESFIESIQKHPEANILLLLSLYGFHRILCFDKEKRELIRKSFKVDMKYFLLKIGFLFVYFHLYAVVPLKILYSYTEYWFWVWHFVVLWITLPLYFYVRRKI